MGRIAGYALVVALAAGCGGSSGSGPTTLPPAPAPSASASPSPSVAPTGAVEQQVLAAVQAYYAEVDRATVTGDVSRLESLTLDDCDCRKLARGIAASYASGTRIEGAVHTVLRPQVTRVAPPAAFVSARLHVSAHELVSKDGSRKAEPADEFPVNIVLGEKAGKWLIIAVKDAG